MNTAIITGGSRSLGKALARELLSRGLHVIIDGRDDAVLDAAERELNNPNLVAIPGDIASKGHVHELFAAARRAGRLELLVNNASTLGEVPLPQVEQLAYETLARLFDVNVFAPVHLMQHALRLMRRDASRGTIVNITSDAALEAYPGWGGYGATKAALEHLSRVLAAELDGTQLRILLADPGDMNTQMHRDAIPDANPNELHDPAESARALLQAIAEMKSAYERVRLQIQVPA
ncbi:MAG: SDR family NAD(P)-dependent oxidoreductase [Candidatus Baltobacteraceae bacterium]